MLKINFNIDKTYLVFEVINTAIAKDGADTFISGKEPREHVQALKNAAEKQDPLACQFLQTDGKLFNIMTLANHSGAKVEVLAKHAEKLLTDISESAIFAPVFEDTIKAVEDLTKEWDSNYKKSLAIMEDLTGLKFHREFEVYVTHPCQAAGHNSSGKIFTTFRLGFPFYNTVYMWHEILHSYILPEAGDHATNERVSHSVIQLIADNELRVRLGGGSYPPFEGHHYLLDTMEYLMPSWREYLASKNEPNALSYLKQAAELEKKRSATANDNKGTSLK